jgi:hypothetical protein
VRFVDYCMACFVCPAVDINNGLIAVSHKAAVTNKGVSFIVYGEANSAQRNISAHISEVMSCERVKHADTCAVCTF